MWLYVLYIPAHDTDCMWVCYSSTESSPCSHLPWHTKTTRFMICLNNSSPQSKVSYTNGIPPRRARECLLLSQCLRREELLQQGHAWLYNMLPCRGSRTKVYQGPSRLTSAQALASCSCRLLPIPGIFPRKSILVLTCSFMISKT